MKKILIVFVLLIITLGGYILITYNKFYSVSQGKKIAQYEAPQKAIMVIDIQKGITGPESDYGLDKKQQNEMISNVNRLLEAFVEKDISVVYIKQIFEDDFFVKLFTGGKMQKGSEEIEFDDGINMVSKNIFVKHIMDAFSNEKLDYFLIKNSVNHLYVTGLDAKACVDKTVKAALNRGYKVTVVKDAVASTSDEIREEKINEFKKLGAEIAETKDVL